MRDLIDIVEHRLDEDWSSILHGASTAVIVTGVLVQIGLWIRTRLRHFKELSAPVASEVGFPKFALHALRDDDEIKKLRVMGSFLVWFSVRAKDGENIVEKFDDMLDEAVDMVLTKRAFGGSQSEEVVHAAAHDFADIFRKKIEEAVAADRAGRRK